MSTFNLSMQEILKICKTYGVSVKEGSGRVTIAAKEFEVKDLFENAFMASVTSASLFSSSEKCNNCEIETSTGAYNSATFLAEQSLLLAA